MTLEERLEALEKKVAALEGLVQKQPDIDLDIFKDKMRKAIQDGLTNCDIFRECQKK